MTTSPFHTVRPVVDAQGFDREQLAFGAGSNDGPGDTARADFQRAGDRSLAAGRDDDKRPQNSFDGDAQPTAQG